MATTDLTMNHISDLGFYEPMRKNWFLIKIDNAVNSKDATSLQIACKTCDLPKLTTAANEVHRVNETVYVPGKSTYNEITASFYEYIRNNDAECDMPSAGKVLYDWQHMVYNAPNGFQGSKKYMSRTADIYQIDGSGSVTRTWKLYNCWPTDVSYDNLDASSGDVQSVSVTLRYDWATLEEKEVTIKESSASVEL